MTIADLLKTLEPIPDDWVLAPYAQLQGVMDGSWRSVFTARFKRHYQYRDSKRAYSYSGELQNIGGAPELDQVILYAQKHHTWQTEQEFGNDPA